MVALCWHAGLLFGFSMGVSILNSNKCVLLNYINGPPIIIYYGLLFLFLYRLLDLNHLHFHLKRTMWAPIYTLRHFIHPLTRVRLYNM